MCRQRMPAVKDAIYPAGNCAILWVKMRKHHIFQGIHLSDTKQNDAKWMVDPIKRGLLESSFQFLL
jgi:hypothetical protein